MSEKTSRFPNIVITSGEPAGIGPDLCVMLAHVALDATITIIADKNVILERARQRGRTLQILDYQPSQVTPHLGNGTLTVWHHPTNAPVTGGILLEANSSHVLNMLSSAVNACMDGTFDAMVTSPVHKGIINDAGIIFSGHTEFLAELTHTKKVVMMLVGNGLRVALVTTHLPLKDVPNAITKENVESTVRIMHHDLVQKFGIANPRILVAGLNPHAGENGYLGDEEMNVINPVLENLRKEGMQLIGALPADTLFTKHHLENADAVLAMYHDQGLPVLKHASFGEGVNVTLGLPIIRTSVDHGTALDLAGTDKIDAGSMFSAIGLAISLVKKKLCN